MPPGAATSPWFYLAPLLVVTIVVLRNARARRLRIERLWITPALLMIATVLTFSQSPPPHVAGLMLDLGAVALGAGLGWWRGRASHFTIDPATHEITSRVSAVGMLLLLGIIALRFLLRGAVTDGASSLHLSAAEAADSFVLMALSVVSAQRLEWWLRARRMIAEAKAGAAGP